MPEAGGLFLADALKLSDRKNIGNSVSDRLAAWWTAGWRDHALSPVQREDPC
jgi:hypothetical protein